jgi:uncharacterized membrane protein
MDKPIKIILSVLLFLCLADMPYGYYQFVRFAAMIGFGILAFQSSESENKTLVIVYGALALLFQPFFKIALGRELWNVVDVIVGAGLIITLFINKQQTKD